MQLIVGLGNPGPKYAGTRHNAGFLVVDELARRRGCSFGRDRHSDVARCGGWTLAKPTTFMNLSGTAVQALMSKGGVRPEGLIVVHDDLDLPLGRVRVKSGGGAGGQRGVQDIASRIGPAFARVRVGIGRPTPPFTAERWVLARFAPDELATVERVVALAADAVEALAREGLEAAMNAVNGVDLTPADARDDAPRGDGPRGNAPAGSSPAGSSPAGDGSSGDGPGGGPPGDAADDPSR